MNIISQITNDEYSRQRSLPKPGDPLYLVLSDYKIALNTVQSNRNFHLLDFGCGSSPYKDLFPNAQYKRADYLNTNNLDYHISEECRIDESDETFDIILSTQVLEHVQKPSLYLQEAYRLLKTDGILICTTHGTYEEHACPHDYHRWTVDGLQSTLSEAGFNIWSLHKITTGIRAAIFLFEQNLNKSIPNDTGIYGKVINSFINLLKSNRAAFHEWCDKALSDFRLTNSMDYTNALYIGIMAIAQKDQKQQISKQSFHNLLVNINDYTINNKQTDLKNHKLSTLHANTSSPINTLTTKCPLTDLPGKLLRTRKAIELAHSYDSYFGKPLPNQIVSKYFNSHINEYQCDKSGLRWYTPGYPAEQDFYVTLGQLYPWYYRDESWDKSLALQIMKQISVSSFLELGCGNGAFLQQARHAGLNGYGIDINHAEVTNCRKQGLPVFHVDEFSASIPHVDTLCLFQTIEHVLDPIGFLRQYIDAIRPTTLIISAPCHEALLGYTLDPLSWPPHHFTAWSKTAFAFLADSLGYQLTATHYEPLTQQRLEGMLRMENSRQLFSLPTIPPGEFGWNFIKKMQALNVKWACYSHSILCVLARKKD